MTMTPELRQQIFDLGTRINAGEDVLATYAEYKLDANKSADSLREAVAQLKAKREALLDQAYGTDRPR